MSHAIPGTTGQKLSPTQIYSLARQAGFSVTDAVTATALALAESGGQTNIANDSTNAAGIWQIYAGSSAAQTLAYQQQMADPLTNAKVAYSKFIGAQKAGQTGWCPWASYDEGSCAGQSGRVNTWRQFLGMAQAAATGEDIAGGGGTLVVPAGAGGMGSAALDPSGSSVVQTGGTGVTTGAARGLTLANLGPFSLNVGTGLLWSILFFVLAGIAIGVGIYLLFRQQINSAVGKAAEVAAVAA